jgi:hypothetical protein
MLANGMKIWEGNGNTTTLVFSLKGLEERRGQVKTIVMEHFNGIVFHKSGPADKQHTNESSILIEWKRMDYKEDLSIDRNERFGYNSKDDGDLNS